MVCKPFKMFSLLFITLLFGSDALAAMTAAQDKNQTLVAGRQITAEQPTEVLQTNNSAFARAVAANDKRNQAQGHWQTFQRSGDDAALVKSLAHLAEATALAPDSKNTWQLAARIHYALRDIPAFKLEAINSFEKLLRLDSQDLSTRILLVDELISIGEWQRASVHLEAMFGINSSVAVDTILDRMVICYLKAGWHQRGAIFLSQQIASADIKEPLLIALAIMERRAGQTDAAFANLGKVLFSNTATKPMRAKARQLKNYWQEHEWVPIEGGSK